jgi:hypothetical protein
MKTETWQRNVLDDRYDGYTVRFFRGDVLLRVRIRLARRIMSISDTQRLSMT